jgi:hypothetical protein
MKRQVLTLLLIAPLFGELVSGATPLLGWLNPGAVVYLIALYGSGAVLSRELVRRRGLGWTNLLILGAAYGVLEEGLVVTSWFNPLWPDSIFLHGMGRFLGINWLWALGLTMYHAVFSITVPVLIVERLFPAQARNPWLGRIGIWGCAAALVAVSLVGLLLFGILLFRNQGYQPPPSYPIAIVIAAMLFVVGLRPLNAPTSILPGRGSEKAPGLWRVRLLGFVATLAWFWAEYIFPSWVHNAILPILALLAIAATAAWLVLRWSARPGWGQDHRLALASGVTGFFLALAPFVEFVLRPPGKPVAGMTLMAFLTLVALIWLAQRAPTLPSSAGLSRA